MIDLQRELGIEVASLREIENWLKGFVRPPDEVPLYLDKQAQVLEGGDVTGKKLRGACPYRTPVRDRRGKLFGTICSCPQAGHKYGVGCTLRPEQCRFIRAYERQFKKADKR